MAGVAARRGEVCDSRLPHLLDLVIQHITQEHQRVFGALEQDLHRHAAVVVVECSGAGSSGGKRWNCNRLVQCTCAVRRLSAAHAGGKANPTHTSALRYSARDLKFFSCRYSAAPDANCASAPLAMVLSWCERELVQGAAGRLRGGGCARQAAAQRVWGFVAGEMYIAQPAAYAPPVAGEEGWVKCERCQAFRAAWSSVCGLWSHPLTQRVFALGCALPLLVAVRGAGGLLCVSASFRAAGA